MAVALDGSRCTDTLQQPAYSKQVILNSQFGCKFEHTKSTTDMLAHLSSAPATRKVVCQANAVQPMSSLSGVVWVTHFQLQDQMFNFISAFGQ